MVSTLKAQAQIGSVAPLFTSWNSVRVMDSAIDSKLRKYFQTPLSVSRCPQDICVGDLPSTSARDRRSKGKASLNLLDGALRPANAQRNDQKLAQAATQGQRSGGGDHIRTIAHVSCLLVSPRLLSTFPHFPTIIRLFLALLLVCSDLLDLLLGLLDLLLLLG